MFSLTIIVIIIVNAVSENVVYLQLVFCSFDLQL